MRFACAHYVKIAGTRLCSLLGRDVKSERTLKRTHIKTNIKTNALDDTIEQACSTFFRVDPNFWVEKLSLTQSTQSAL